MNIHDRLFVEIHPLESGQIPHPHPVTEARFDPALVYKVLGMYNASETSECYFVLVNTQRQIWFIPQRHLLAYGLIDSNDFFLTKDVADQLRLGASNSPLEPALSKGVNEEPLLQGVPAMAGRGEIKLNGSHSNGRNGFPEKEAMPTGDRHRGF